MLASMFGLWRNRGLLLLALVAGTTACEDEQVSQRTALFDFDPAHLDFGRVELGQQKIEVVTIRNLDLGRGLITSSEIKDDCGGCFQLLNPISELKRNEEHALNVRFRAQRLRIATATATFTTDDPQNGTVTITMVGRGSDSRRPDIKVSPAAIDFGFVPSGGIAISSFLIQSTGTNDLLIDRIRIEPANAPFRITTSTPAPQMPGRLAPDARASVSLRAELPESVTVTITATIFIESNVLEEKNVPGKPGWVQIPLTAKGNLPPIAVPGENQTVEPWSRVTLDGSKSYDQDNPPDEPLSYRWTLVSTPGGSTTELERSRTAKPSFWADLTGTYELELVVTDALGLESEAAKVVVEALPTNAVRIELTWDHPDSDLDLHLIREGGTFCDCNTSVHYRDCARTPDWYPMTPGANPRLDVDDRAGFGPENINIDGHGASRFIPDGRYTIAVHYYSTAEEVSSWPTSVSNATLRVYVYGLLAAEFTQAMREDDDVWIAGTIQWPEQNFMRDGTIVPKAMCGSF